MGPKMALQASSRAGSPWCWPLRLQTSLWSLKRSQGAELNSASARHRLKPQSRPGGLWRCRNHRRNLRTAAGSVARREPGAQTHRLETVRPQGRPAPGLGARRPKPRPAGPPPPKAKGSLPTSSASTGCRESAASLVCNGITSICLHHPAILPTPVSLGANFPSSPKDTSHWTRASPNPEWPHFSF